MLNDWIQVALKQGRKLDIPNQIPHTILHTFKYSRCHKNKALHNLMSTLFTGTVFFNFCCTQCGYCQQETKDFYKLMLTLSNSVQNSLNDFFQIRSIDSDKFICNQCKNHQTFHKHYYLKYEPQFLYLTIRLDEMNEPTRLRESTFNINSTISIPTNFCLQNIQKDSIYKLLTIVDSPDSRRTNNNISIKCQDNTVAHITNPLPSDLIRGDEVCQLMYKRFNDTNAQQPLTNVLLQLNMRPTNADIPKSNFPLPVIPDNPFNDMECVDMKEMNCPLSVPPVSSNI